MSWKRLLLQLAAQCLALLLAYAYLLRLERRAMARLPLRRQRGWGPLWPLVDALRALTKPGVVDRRRVWLGALLGICLFLAALCLLPSGPDYYLAGFRLWAPFSRWDADLLSVTVLGLLPALAPWLMGQLSAQPAVREGGRETAQRAAAFAVPALLALTGAVVVTDELSLGGMVRWQADGLPLALYQPLGLILFALSSLLASRRLPATDDVPQPALLDFHRQHAGRAWALAHMVEYLSLFFSSAVMAQVYLAGWAPRWGGLPGLALKTLVAMALLLWLRQLWCRRWRQRFQAHAWRLLMALGALNALVTAAAVLLRGGG